RLKQSNVSLEQDLSKKREELAQAQREAARLGLVDQASNKRQAELERKLSDHERLAKIERLRASSHADLVLKTINSSAKCEIENFFRNGGQCRSGQWVADGQRSTPKSERAAATGSQGETSEAR